MKHLVLYHGNCRDGQVAAWAAKRALGDEAIYIPCQHGSPIPKEVIHVGPWGKVFILDFSFRQAPMEHLAQNAEHVFVLDHHVTAKNDLTNWPTKPENVHVKFNMEASGAYLSWWYFADPGEACPPIVQYAQDHDLWQFKLPNSRQIRAWLQTVPLDDIDAITRANDLLTESFPMCVAVGTAIEQATLERCRSAASKSYPVLNGKYRVANVTADISEVGSHLLDMHPECEATMTYFDDWAQKIRRFSLRSRKGGLDVAELARGQGGGGHASAGFETSIYASIPFEILK